MNLSYFIFFYSGFLPTKKTALCYLEIQAEYSNFLQNKVFVTYVYNISIDALHLILAAVQINLYTLPFSLCCCVCLADLKCAIRSVAIPVTMLTLKLSFL